MAAELLVGKKDGTIFNISGSATDVTLTTNRTGSPGCLKFTMLRTLDFGFSEGDAVRFSMDGELQFFGWVFTRTMDRWGVMEVTCYDRLRYLKANASYAFYDQSAADILRQIAADLQLSTGAVSDTGYKIPSLLEEDQSCLDILNDAIQQTLLNTGKIYVLYDDGQGLALQEAGEMKTDLLIGDKSLLTDYTYKSDIDQQTYNSVKLARPNEETGMADVVIALDSETISRWGLLQLYQKVDGSLNTAQMQAQAAASLAYYNRPLQTMTVEALGVPGLRAGQMVMLKLSELDGKAFERWLLIEKAAHRWENGLHTMTLDLTGIGE